MTPENIIPKIIRGTLAAALLFVAAIFAIPVVSAGNRQNSNQQKSGASQNSMPGMDMGDMQGMEQNSDAAKAATGAMSDMSDEAMQGADMMAHMHMTDLRHRTRQIRSALTRFSRN